MNAEFSSPATTLSLTLALSFAGVVSGNAALPDVVHILSAGKIVKTGDKDLALKLEKHGYDAVVSDAA